MSHIEFIAGCNAGFFAVLVGHPFDTIKVKLQLTGKKPLSLLKNENFFSLYRGVSSPLIFLTSINALVFGTHANLKKLFDENNRKKLYCEFICGFFTGASQSLLNSPMELLKSRLQTKSMNLNYNNLVKPKINLLEDIKNLKTDYPNQSLLKSLYRGFGATLSRDAPAFGIYFSSYEYFLRFMNPDNQKNKPSNIVVLCSGGIAGALSWVLIYPVDTIKTHIQLNPGLTTKKFLTDIYKNQGWNGLKNCLFRGLLTCTVRAFPVNAVTFYVYDLSIRYL